MRTTASGIGRETAWFFAERGASAVVFLDLNLPGAEEAAEESKKYATHKDYKCMAVKVDVSEREMMREAVQKVADTYGRIDYFVNSSGVSADRLPDGDASRTDSKHRSAHGQTPTSPRSIWTSSTCCTRSTRRACSSRRAP